ncbi:TetR/AcrR family transcriptional regulator [Boseongicola aestuarii]|uniref:HTH-type transcriptional regulator AcrR n=1 Tax=Boseongicola aestuarii TaxID=1470561 RepID=A0A238IVJ7_9RHOB|nr:TetR/AcrR family transcriptional regulator [Boseongicola aestuarii]SMX22498.1 HTH-type transcriptional regulator AcrR [Boseongicola aestuarii]
MTNEPFYIDIGDPAGKQRILREGLRLFAEKGLSATSIRDIAAATGLTNPALYKHFKTKDDLALALFERSYSELLKRLMIAVRSEKGFPQRFKAFIAAYASFFDENSHATMFTTDNLATLWPQASERLKHRTVITVLRELLEEGRTAQLVNREEDINLQLSLVIGTLGQVSRQLYLGSFPGPAVRYVDGVTRILRAGLT